MEGEKANGKTDRMGRHDHRRLKKFSDSQNGDAWLPTGRHLRPPRGRSTRELVAASRQQHQSHRFSSVALLVREFQKEGHRRE
eukprot:364135-Rhodomonas_salina.1